MIFLHDISPEIVQMGPISIRWYGLLFSTGIAINYLIARWVFKRERYPISDLDSIATYLFSGLIIGARLGEVLFYEPTYYLRNPSEIIKIWHGGLSSHGAAIGLFLSYLLWIKIHKGVFTKYVDAIVLGMPITAAFVRAGNFFNSEIVGVPTDGSWGVVFKRLGEDFPRHPVQLYEGFLNILIFVILFLLYNRGYYRKTPPLFFLSLYLLLYFGGRFIIEFWKDLHVLPVWFPLSMGQLLSILPVLLGAWYFAILFPRHEKRSL